ncbi:MAG: DNA-directed RNA polymerase subunit omega [Candidatus Omnitrophica bacterium]|nr:DNA-directed RNA polymerase subunit omega [Candidatus Omnitrophota bacterium]
MTDLPIEELLPQANYSVYKLVSMAAIRSLELSDGRRCLAENINTEKFTTMALHEIAQGKIRIKEATNGKPLKEAAQEEPKEEALAEQELS